MAKVISMTCLHYGADYLAWALRSIVDSVDECWVLYTPQGSFGAHANMPCPDSEAVLFAAAQLGAGNKLRWHKGDYHNEGQHRDAIYTLCPDFYVMMIVDADEIWQPGLAGDVVSHFERHPDHKSVRIVTPQFWRSFYRGMPNDGLYAEHGWNRHGTQTGMYLESDKQIFHFGYAQNEAVTYYKQFTHGHRDEWKKDWFDTKFLPNSQFDVHPVINNFWNAEALDPFAMGLPEWMRTHPYAGLEVIP